MNRGGAIASMFIGGSDTLAIVDLETVVNAQRLINAHTLANVRMTAELLVSAPNTAAGCERETCLRHKGCCS